MDIISLVGTLLMVFMAPLMAQAPSVGPLSVVNNFFDAEHAGNIDAALAHWADDGMFVNTRGQRRIGREQLKMFIQNAINAKIHHEMKSPRAEGELATWLEDETTDFYQKLGVAPVQTVSDALVQGGKIKTIVVRFPPGEIVRIEQSCGTPKAEGVIMFGLTCTEFVRLARAHTESFDKK